ncbi:MAG TPA: amino acid permease, partial [Polyangia bacterium]|nr:amino acid permease [Polyangia bacterium]
MPTATSDSAHSSDHLQRRLGPFDATMIVMGGIVGSGIFVTPATVARSVGTTGLILGAWLIGGVAALAGAFVYAELAARRPHVGGQYAYLRDAYHPAVAFLYGWALLLVIQTGGMAASAVTFARYALELWPNAPHILANAQDNERALGTLALALLTAVNCVGVRAGGGLQSLLMLLKIGAILALVVGGLWRAGGPSVDGGAAAVAPDTAGPFALVGAMGAALIPVLFSYGGWQTAGFVAGEIKEPARNLPRAMLLGVAGVIALYVLVAFVCVRVLGPAGLGRASAPALDVMRRAFGARGAQFLAAAVSLSTLGFLSQSILTAPRVYYAMANDGLFFAAVGKLDRRTHVPVAAIVLQGALAGLIALWGHYDGILSYVVSIDFIFFGLTASGMFSRTLAELQVDPAQLELT